MAGKAAGDDIKGGDLFKALIDLVILALLMVGAGFGGYWYGVHERLAPVKSVAPGTPGAQPATAVSTAPVTTPAGTAAPVTMPNSTTPASTTATATAPTATPKKMKYWIASSGTDWVGYNITVNVNDKAVDSFFIANKIIDITKYVQHGENSISFQAKDMGDKYNKHKNDSKAQLKLQLVHGPAITEDFKPSDVILSYSRNAAESEDKNDTLSFTDGD
jgi:hypothetical protein